MALGALALAAPVEVSAQVAVTRTRFELPTSNGYGALLVHLDDADAGQARRAVHFREHLFAAEEPILDAQGDEVWGGSDFEAIYTRDLLYDAYFGLRGPGGNLWLPTVGADLDASGYAGWQDGTMGGTGIVQLVQTVGDLQATSYFFAPLSLEANAFVMVLAVENTGNATVSGVQGFSIHNFHLGYGRAESPWEVGNDIGENGETLTRTSDANGEAFIEQGFAGVVAARAVGNTSHFGVAPDQAIYDVVDGGGTADLPDNTPSGAAVTGAVGAWQFDLGDIPAGQTRYAAVVFAHHGDPTATTATLGLVDSYIDDRSAQALLDDEVGEWADFQNSLTIPSDASAGEERLVRSSATMLRMGQVREDEFFLREFLSQDGEVRRTRFPDKSNPAQLPATVQHNGSGAILASMPPGNWTYAWIRDGSYAIAAMSKLGMDAEARDALAYYLNAEANRFKDWTELADYNMPDYQITLTRYYGFGIEETDFNDFGPNLEFDGFGLFLWALRQYEVATGDETLADQNYDLIAERVADVIVALVEPDTGLLLPDSSIWESHWEGRERHWAYTNITAVRGLCDAADIAERNGDDARATTYRDTANSIREAIATRLTDDNGGIASNLEELEVGQGHWDAAVIDGISMGLFDPEAQIAQGTIAGLDANLLVDASEVGWSRNDDRYDHPGTEDLSPWGSDYDSAEWVITDLRGAIAHRLAGDTDRSDALLQWILDQSNANYLMVAETFEENTGEWKFNHPMLGFGAGAYSLALFQRADNELPAACGVYYEGGSPGDTDGGTDSGSGTDSGTGGSASASGGGTDSTGSASNSDGITVSASVTDSDSGTDSAGASGDDGGCGCVAGRPSAPWTWVMLLLTIVPAVRRRHSPTRPYNRV